MWISRKLVIISAVVALLFYAGVAGYMAYSFNAAATRYLKMY